MLPLLESSVDLQRSLEAAQERLRFIEFQQPTLVETPPDGDGWLHEIKYDGYRTELIVEDGKARAFTRRGFDWSDKYGPIVEAGRRASGEVRDHRRRGDRAERQERCRTSATLRSTIRWQPERLIFVAFDLLHLDGEDLRFRPLIERRARLQEIIPDDGAIQFSRARHRQWQGILCRGRPARAWRASSRRRRARPIAAAAPRRWLKVKCFEESIYEVAAVLREPGRPHVAYMVTPDKERRYVGGAFIALNEKMRERLWARVRRQGEAAEGRRRSSRARNG